MTNVPAGRGVTCLGFASDASRLAVGTLGGRLSVWQVRPAQMTHELATAAGPFEAVTFAADGLSVATTGRDGAIWLRRLPASSRASAPPPVQPLSATRLISSSYRLFDWLRRVALL